ncbi:hypothetical protein LSAT2_004338 [Lamellibrachia satsuma]|nr:hypothetical protein LSAT2_004338 [Lamellibrachia satsuma]
MAVVEGNSVLSFLMESLPMFGSYLAGASIAPSAVAMSFTVKAVYSVLRRCRDVAVQTERKDTVWKSTRSQTGKVDTIRRSLKTTPIQRNNIPSTEVECDAVIGEAIVELERCLGRSVQLKELAVATENKIFLYDSEQHQYTVKYHVTQQALQLEQLEIEKLQRRLRKFGVVEAREPGGDTWKPTLHTIQE